MDNQESEIETDEESSAVIYWVEEKKVGIAPLVLVSPSDRSVGTYTKIRPPGFQKEYVGRIEGISADPDELEKIQAEVSQRIDSEAANTSAKRLRSKVRRFGQPASEAALQVASGNKRSVPNELLQVNNAVSKAAKVVKANQKAAKSALTKLVHQTLNSNISKSKLVLQPKNGSGTCSKPKLNARNAAKGSDVIQHGSPEKGKMPERKAGNTFKNALNLNDEEDQSVLNNKNTLQNGSTCTKPNLNVGNVTKSSEHTSPKPSKIPERKVGYSFKSALNLNPEEDQSDLKKKNTLQVGKESTQHSFNPYDLMDDSALSEGEEQDEIECVGNDESDIDSLVAFSKQSAATMNDSGHNVFPQNLPVSKPHVDAEKCSKQSPQTPSQSQSKKSSLAYSKDCEKSEVYGEKSVKSPFATLSSEGEELSDMNKAEFFQFMRLKKMYTPSVASFLNELMECFSDDQQDKNNSGEAQFVETISPPSSERQVEISKGSGVSITATAKQIVLVTGAKMGPGKMLTALIHELFKDRLKLIHGTTTIRPHVLKAIIAFMEKNSDKATALTIPEIKRILNNLASEARRNRTKSATKAIKPPKRGKPSPSSMEVTTTPAMNDSTSPKKTPQKESSCEQVTTTPSKNIWTVNDQVGHYAYPHHYQNQYNNQYPNYQYYDYNSGGYQYQQHGGNAEQTSFNSPKRMLQL